MILVGTSGYNYPEWKGSFYPSDLPVTKMLPYYAGKFPTVEINYTFYRMPTPKLIAGWRAQVPETFRFTLKAPKRITHDKRLRAAEVEQSVQGFITAAAELGPQLAALLFQLPPNFKKDVGLLNEFLALLPPKTTAAFEFRNPSWLDDEVYDALRARNIALCFADSETRETPLVSTADYAYFRLRDEGYGDADIARWAETATKLSANAKDVFVYFKHEDEGKGAAFGQQMMNLLGQTT
ncbi:MAG TPA: DUF72 domain-containing protein [Vicinamibacterales bacterium]|nr:DUF72 domain-containing protein [Vicinamibacterales bacterium]